MPAGLQLFGAADVVVIVGVAAVDEDVARLQQRPQLPRSRVSTSAAGTMIHTARGGVSAAHQLRERAGAPARRPPTTALHRLGDRS